MRSFQMNNINWIVSVLPYNVERVRAECGLDLLKALDGGEDTEKLSDYINLIKALWILCEEQAEKESVSREQFMRSILGDVLDEAENALLGAIIDFFPKSRRTLYQKAWTAGQTEREKATKLAIKSIDEMDKPKKRTGSKRSTKSQASSASTQTD